MANVFNYVINFVKRDIFYLLLSKREMKSRDYSMAFIDLFASIAVVNLKA